MQSGATSTTIVSRVGLLFRGVNHGLVFHLQLICAIHCDFFKFFLEKYGRIFSPEAPPQKYHLGDVEV